MATVCSRIEYTSYIMPSPTTYHHMSACPWISNAATCSHISCLNDYQCLVTCKSIAMSTYRSRMKTDHHLRIEPSCKVLQHGSAEVFLRDTTWSRSGAQRWLSQYWWNVPWCYGLRRAVVRATSDLQRHQNGSIRTTMRLQWISCIGDFSLMIFPLRLKPFCCLRKQLSKTA